MEWNQGQHRRKRGVAREQLLKFQLFSPNQHNIEANFKQRKYKQKQVKAWGHQKNEAHFQNFMIICPILITYPSSPLKFR